MQASKHIFIASSQEAKLVAKSVAETLAGNNLLPVPWWEAFPLGTYTFEQLNHQSKSVDAAIIIASTDDTVWYREKEYSAPRDNIILECGLFAARLSLKRTILLVQPGAKVPSDLSGVTYMPLEKDVMRSAEDIVRHLKVEFDQDRRSGADSILKVICDPLVASYQVSNPPAKWLMRAMYLGTEGARAWLAISQDPAYQKSLENARLKNKLVEFIQGGPTTFRTYVALGPGDGEIDTAIAISILEREPTAQCIPVDLSDGLLQTSGYRLSSSIRVPIALLSDFEGNLPFIIRHVHEYGKRPYLYSLIGNTFGNLDGDEHDFLMQFKSRLDRGDELLIEVAVPKSGTRPLDGTDVSTWGDGQKMFFAHGASRILNVTTKEVFENFEKLVTVTPQGNLNPIENTVTMTFRAAGKPFAWVRRYDFDSFITYLKDKGLHVRHTRFEAEGILDSGIVAIRLGS